MTLGYRLVRGLAGLLVRLFYRQVDVVGLERVPARGGLLLAANHQNALVDPMLLMATVPRPLRPLAKAPLFRHPVIAPFLRLVGAVPVHRRQDAEGGAPAAGANDATFAAVGAALARGEGVLVFPEGVSQPEPALQPLRTGAARMVLAAHDPAGGRAVTLLPVGLVVHQPGTFRGGWALVVFGEPVPLGSAGPAGARAAEPAEVGRQVTDRLAAALRALIVDAGDRETLRLLRVAEAIWRAPGAGPEPPAARAAWLRSALRGYRHLAATEPARLEAVRREVERHGRELERLALRGSQLDIAYEPAAATRYALREGAALLLALPLALAGLLAHGAPYWLTALLTRLLRPSLDSEATVKLAAGLVLYPLAWAVEAWLIARYQGPLALGLFLLLLLPSGFLALTWQERLTRLRREARAFVRFVLDRDLATRLRERRRQLAVALEDLARLVPPAGPEGPGGPGGPTRAGP